MDPSSDKKMRNLNRIMIKSLYDYFTALVMASEL